MGDTGISGYIFGILLALLIATGALYMKNVTVFKSNNF